MNSVPVEPRITEYLYRKASVNNIPLSGTFEITPLCNMDCKMCYVKISKEKQSKIRPLRRGEEWLQLAENLKKAGMLYLLITGGEPFLHPDIKEILTGLHKMGFLVSINSNGTLIDEKTIEWLKNCPPYRINISLYGKDDDTYSRLCSNSKGFTQVSRAITLLKDAGISIKLNCSITPYNKDDVDAMFDFANKNGLVLQTAAYMFPPARKDVSLVGKNVRLTPKEAAFYSAYTEYLSIGRDRFLGLENNLSLPTDSDDNCAKVGDGIRCRAGKCSFWVTWEGYLIPCGMFPCVNAKNVFENDFLTIWKELVAEVNNIRLPKECANCSLKNNCRACGAMVVTESGNFTDVPQYRCEMTKAYVDEYKKLAEKIREGNYEQD